MKNEKTGKDAASISGRWMAKIKNAKPTGSIPSSKYLVKWRGYSLGTITELKKVLASNLTQAPDKAGKRK